MENFQMRTDLALEARESITEADSELRGVRVEEYDLEEEDIHVTKVMIDTKNAAKAMGKPMGIYVTECIPDGPAYDAGIQNGDIIVGVGGQDISTMKDYQNQMEILTSGAVVTVVVQRRGIDEYKELEYEVSVGAR